MVAARRAVRPSSSSARPAIRTMIASVPVNGRLPELDDRVAVAAAELAAEGEVPDALASSAAPASGDEPFDEPLDVSPATPVLPARVEAPVIGAAAACS